MQDKKEKLSDAIHGLENLKRKTIEEERKMELEEFQQEMKRRPRLRDEAAYQSARGRYQALRTLYPNDDRWDHQKRRIQIPRCWTRGSETHFKISCPCRNEKDHLEPRELVEKSGEARRCKIWI